EDPMEEKWPDVGNLILEDSETGERKMMPPNLKGFQRDYNQRVKTLREAQDKMFKKINMDRVKFQTNEEYTKPLLNFFRERERRFR
ncbi:MAG: hypothetical protein LHV69_09185, partial [Elusimicrobia bacterium]|nr:hypothetical protein [Candidatus Obscuribacterium magneticum]